MVEGEDEFPRDLRTHATHQVPAHAVPEVALKGDGETPYVVVKKVMDLLQENKVNKFNLVTNLTKEEVLLKDLPPATK